MTQKHGHYYKDITNLKKLDVYRIAELYNVNGAIEHAIKKLLLAGGRGVKDMRTDIQEAIDSLNRKLEMLNEDEHVEMMDKQNDLEYKSVGQLLKDNDYYKNCYTQPKTGPSEKDKFESLCKRIDIELNKMNETITTHQHNSDVMINLEDIKYPLPATSLNARCYVAEVDSDSNFHQESVSCDTQSLDPKYKDELNFEAYLPSNFEVEEFLKKYPAESYDSAFRKLAISNFQNMKYKLK